MSKHHGALLRLAVLATVCLSLFCRAGEVRGQTIYVKILVDEEEPANPRGWHRRLGQRLVRASDVISEACSLRFAPSCYGTWNSDDGIQDLSRSLREFEAEVSPAPAQIAVGFTSQYRFKGRGRQSMGGTRGPLRSHILIREGAATVHEMERVEVLVHELGHFLGAAHSSNPESVMRPVMGEGLARSKKFQIRFDPDNARIIRLVAAEIRDLHVRRFEQLSLRTKLRLRASYVKLAKQAPNDPTAPKYIRLIDRSLPGASLRPTPAAARQRTMSPNRPAERGAPRPGASSRNGGQPRPSPLRQNDRHWIPAAGPLKRIQPPGNPSR